MTKRLRALLVEDSPTQARALAQILEADGDIEVVATASTAPEAVASVDRHRPDVVTMDLDIPAGGGQAAIKGIMDRTPTPILVLSGVIGGGDEPQAVRALAAGAVDAVPKPRTWTAADAAGLRRHVRRVGSVPVIRRSPPRRGAPPPVPETASRSSSEGVPIVAIAASTGGPAAVASVVAGLAGVPAAVLLVQHIHPTFAAGFATWLERSTGASVCVARGGSRARPGQVYVAPGDRHLALAPRDRLVVSREPEHLHRPSADVLFASVAESAGARAIGVILTGMGNDGASGLAAVRRAGGATIGQDQSTSTVFGMPAAAMAAGALQELLPLSEVPAAVRRAVMARCR